MSSFRETERNRNTRPVLAPGKRTKNNAEHEGDIDTN